MSGAGADARLAELEAKVTFQEQALAELSRSVYEQSRQLDALTARCKRTEEQLRRWAPHFEGADREADAPPPHY